MMVKISILFGLMAGVLVLNGCTSQQDNVFGEQKQAPDEFAVYSRAPLSLPPDFGLRPPRPGANRPQTLRPRNDAKEALLSSGGKRPAKSGQAPAPSETDLTPGIRALLNNTGADQANPDIRSLVNSETAALSGVGDESFADSILFWRQNTGVKGAVIDPAVEERRMRKNKGKDVAIEEAPAPTIKRSGGGASRDKNEKGFWGRLFDF